MIPQHYLDMINSIRTYYRDLEQDRVNTTNAQVGMWRTSTDKDQQRLTELTNQFMQTGVFIFANRWETIPKVGRTHGQHYTQRMTVYARQLAKSLKRPYVRVENNSLYIPKLKKLDVLSTPFLFTAKPPIEYVYYAREPGVYEVTNRVSIREYYFMGNEGKQHLDTWLEYIKSPECRSALGIT